MERTPFKMSAPVRAALLYAVLGSIYIVGSAAFVHWTWSDNAWKIENTIEVYKGLIFIWVTTALLYGTLNSAFKRLQLRTEQAESNERQYRDLFELIPEPVWVYELETLRLLAVNTAACQRYGWTREEFLSLTLRDIRPPEDMGLPEAAVARSNHAEMQTGMFRHRRKDGEVFPVQVTSRPFDFEGVPARMVVAWDISEVTTARESLERLNESLERRVAERTDRLRKAMVELEWFGEAVSHDLKQPIEHLRTLATQLLTSAGERLDATEREAAHRLVGASARLGNLVDDLLEFARADWEGGQPVSLVLVVNETLGHLRREQPGSFCDVQLMEPLGWVPAHRPTLARVVMGMLRPALSQNKGSGVVIRMHPAGEGKLELVVECPDAAVNEATRQALTPVNAGTELKRPKESGIALLLRSAWRLGGELTYQKGDRGRGSMRLTVPGAEGV